MKTFEHPPRPRRSLRLRPKASPAYARGQATPLTLTLTLQQSPNQLPLALCLGPLPLSPLPITPFPIPQPTVSYLRLVPFPNKTGSDKRLYDRIRQDPQNGPRQDPTQSAPLPLLLCILLDLPTPTPSNLYLQTLFRWGPNLFRKRIGCLTPLSSEALFVLVSPTSLPPRLPPPPTYLPPRLPPLP